MLVWLGEWLRNLIAVILLAAVVELLIPNQQMLRYSRLAIGLIILLTLMSPVIKLFQEDFTDQLEASISLWELSTQSTHRDMPTLEDIKQKAEKLKEDREKESMKLTELELEKAMLAEIERNMNIPIEKLDVAVQWDEERQSLYIQQVVITLPDHPQSESLQQDEVAIDVVVPVDIESIVPVEPNNPLQTFENGEEPQYITITDEKAEMIAEIISRHWNVSRKDIDIRHYRG